MGRIRILTPGKNTAAQAQARGKLFEALMAEVLRHFGFSIDKITSTNYSGMEIDIEGRANATGIHLYAECKFYETEVDCPKLQAFVGKYTTRWRRDDRCQGLFIAVPGVNSHAKGFYRDNFEGAQDMTVKLIEEEAVLKSIFDSRVVCSPDIPAERLSPETGKAGDWSLVYTERGFFFVFNVIPPGSAIPKALSIFDATGSWITDDDTIDYIRRLDPGLISLEVVPGPRAPRSHIILQADPEEIVEVRGSSSCFEYQFPSAPEFFVGRKDVLRDIELLVEEVLKGQTSARGVLFEGNSGIGKSSVVLSVVSRLTASGHFALSIDCRSASSPQFVLRAVSHILSNQALRLAASDGQEQTKVLGLDSAAQVLVQLGECLRRQNRLLFVFFDQFENLFFLPEVLRPIRDVFLRVCDAQTNVLLGFSWKTDLFGLTSEFPYQMRDAISSASRRIPLQPFSEPETSDMLDKLALELRSKLRKDLTFFLSEFSQGYPWLLKKLCAHVKQQREEGVPQAEIAGGLLNVGDLFEDDLHGLSPEQEEALRRIGKAAPISIADLSEEIRPDVLQSLVNARLVIRVGTKIDLYWDIFKDYLNSGRIPIQENYILRMQVGSVLKAARLVNEMGSEVDAGEFQKRAALTEKSFYNIIKELRILGVAKVDRGRVHLLLSPTRDAAAFESALRGHIKDRLRRNRLMWALIQRMDNEEELGVDDIARTLEQACPYVRAGTKTWRTYARVFADWMDFADFAVFDPTTATLQRYRPGAEVRERRLAARRRRSSISSMPAIQFTPVLEVCGRVAAAWRTGDRVDVSGLRPSTITKALATLEDLGFIVRKRGSIGVTDRMAKFADNPAGQRKLLADAALLMPAFACFVELLHEQLPGSVSLLHLGRELSARLGLAWKDGTTQTIAKILLDWARHTGLAPDRFAEARKGRFGRREEDQQRDLF